MKRKWKLSNCKNGRILKTDVSEATYQKIVAHKHTCRHEPLVKGETTTASQKQRTNVPVKKSSLKGSKLFCISALPFSFMLSLQLKIFFLLWLLPFPSFSDKESDPQRLGCQQLRFIQRDLV